MRRAVVCVLLSLAVCCIGAGFLAYRGRPARGPRDPFLDKYERIGSTTPYKEATQFLGPPTGSVRPGGTLADYVCWWQDDRGHSIMVTWDCCGRFTGKKFRDERGMEAP